MGHMHPWQGGNGCVGHSTQEAFPENTARSETNAGQITTEKLQRVKVESGVKKLKDMLQGSEVEEELLQTEIELSLTGKNVAVEATGAISGSLLLTDEVANMITMSKGDEIPVQLNVVMQ